jgi:hypothetical protein
MNIEIPADLCLSTNSTSPIGDKSHRTLWNISCRAATHEAVCLEEKICLYQGKRGKYTRCKWRSLVSMEAIFTHLCFYENVSR